MRMRMKEKTMSFFGDIGTWIAYLPGIAVMFFFWLGRRLGRIKVLHEERLPESIEDIVFVYNHPSVADHWFIAGLLSRYYVRHPLTQMPLIAADRKLFYNSKTFLLRIFRSAMIPIDRPTGRGAERSDAATVLELRNTHRPILICPEGGRTFRGDEGDGWLYCKGGNDENGGKIRPFKSGAGNLIKRRGATALPIAIVGSHKVVPNSKEHLWTHFNFFETITIVVGKPMRFDPKATKLEITNKIQVKMLALISEAL